MKADDFRRRATCLYGAAAPITSFAQQAGLSPHTVSEQLRRGSVPRLYSALLRALEENKMLRDQLERRRRRSDIVVADVCQLYMSGISANRIARQYGLATSSITRALHSTGVSLRKSGPYRKLNVEEAVKLAREGVTVKEIAARMSVSKQAVYTAIKMAGVPTPTRRGK
jgi:DNA-binding CsgD family transcriptional regulator